ncbi:MAG: methyltransferase [Bacteroidetes bacterium]|nr:methyltransferase [Bacteroidota bacterium]
MRRPFQMKQFAIEQGDVTLPVTTDACLFGALIQCSGNESIIDAGTGTGLLCLMLAQRYPGIHCTGVELDETTAVQARANAESSPFADRIEIWQADVLELPRNSIWDMVVCNPPFFANQLPSVNARKRQARHTVSLDFDSLAGAMVGWVKPDGKIWLLLPPEGMQQMQGLLQPMGFEITASISIRSLESRPVHTMVACFEQGVSKNIRMEILTTYNAPGEYTEQAADLLAPFYLHL